LAKFLHDHHPRTQRGAGQRQGAAW
jgi:hypothetical protein